MASSVAITSSRPCWNMRRRKRRRNRAMRHKRTVWLLLCLAGIPASAVRAGEVAKELKALPLKSVPITKSGELELGARVVTWCHGPGDLQILQYVDPGKGQPDQKVLFTIEPLNGEKTFEPTRQQSVTL